MEGENFFIGIGRIFNPTFKLVGAGDYAMFKASLGIPTAERKGYQFIRITAWYGIAEALNEVDSNTFIKIHGHIENGSYNAPCKYCQSLDKKYTTDVIVDNFITLKGN